MDIYIEKILKYSTPNKYTKWYCSLVKSRYDYARDKETANAIHGYTESHHIWPDAFCLTEFEEKDPSNRVHLTAREHFIAHWLLSKMFTDELKNSMECAFLVMNFDKENNRNFKSWQFEILRRLLHKREVGKIVSEESKKRMSVSAIKRWENKELRIQTGIERKKFWSDENVRKSASDLSKNLWMTDEYKESHKVGVSKQPKIVCIYCGKALEKYRHDRFHGEKCKENGIYQTIRLKCSLITT
jgi:hypothetical protein